MGGSSLAPLVIGELHGSERLHVLDSTDPDAVRAVPVEGSLFVIASKSGSTIEPNCFADAFWGKTGGDGSRFVAITDPGSALEERARKRRLGAHRPRAPRRRRALLGADGVRARARPCSRASTSAPMLARASAALAKCHDDFGVNPGQTLAARDRQRARQGPRQADVRDAAGSSRAIGLWLEQLIAESTGKQGTGVLPVAGEPLGDAVRLRRRPALRPPPPGHGLRRAGRRAQRPARGRAAGLHACSSTTTRPTSARCSSSGRSRRRSSARGCTSTPSTSRTCRRPRTARSRSSRASRRTASCRPRRPAR